MGQQGEESHQEHQAGHRKEDVAPDEERVHYLTGEEREMFRNQTRQRKGGRRPARLRVPLFSPSDDRIYK